MDILAAMFAYLACVGGVVGTLVLGAVVFFSAPGPQAAPQPHGAIAAAKPGNSRTSTATVKAAKAEAHLTRTVRALAAGASTPAPPLADASHREPRPSSHTLRRLAAKDRAKHWAKHLAYRESSSFESRFLHYDD